MVGPTRHSDRGVYVDEVAADGARPVFVGRASDTSLGREVVSDEELVKSVEAGFDGSGRLICG